MEKTPSNCLRVPFVRQIFPDALFIHVIRDGRACATSARVQWQHDFLIENDQVEEGLKTNTSHVALYDERGLNRRLYEAIFTIKKFLIEKRRLSGGVWTFLEAPAYVPDLFRVVARKVTNDRSFVWGTRFPGIHEMHRTFSLLEVCAIQWAYNVQSVLLHTSNLPDHQLLSLNYETFSHSPVSTLRQIIEFAGLSHAEEIYELAARRIRPDQGRWRTTLSKEEIQVLDFWIGPLLDYLGYEA
jgi:hypothetical protein